MDQASRYVLIGLLWMIAAMIQGLWMGIAGATQYVTLHVIMMLAGGVVGIVFGSVLRGWPKAGAHAWTGPQLILWNVGILIQAVGAVTRAWGWGDTVIGIGSVVVLVAGLMMLVIFYRGAET